MSQGDSRSGSSDWYAADYVAAELADTILSGLREHGDIALSADVKMVRLFLEDTIRDNLPRVLRHAMASSLDVRDSVVRKDKEQL